MAGVYSSENDEEDISKLPKREECEERCQRFAAVTETDTALAMFYLQDRDWDIERALNAFFEDRGIPSCSSSISYATDHAAVLSSVEKTDKKSEPLCDGSVKVSNLEQVGQAKSNRVRLMSWNIDGLDQNNVCNRAQGVCDIINKEKPHIVFLQEVVPKNMEVIERLCTSYLIIPAGEIHYYNAILLRTDEVVYEDSTVLNFTSSEMSRALLSVECKVKDLPCVVMTTHLESMKNAAEERSKQLKMSLEKVTNTPSCRTVLFGGDLNLRDTEAAKVSIPENIYDLWEVTGKRPEAKFTWDMMRNDNLEFDRFKPRCRFDRLFIRHSSPGPRLKPVYFELVGLERLKSCRRFPSDHWGLLVHFNTKSALNVEVKENQFSLVENKC